jgi:anti-sigma B factor antagonist
MTSGDVVVREHPVAPGARVVEVRGEIDAATAPGYRTALTEAVAEVAATASAVVVDLTRVTFVSSLGVSVLLALHQQAVDAQTDLHLVARGTTLRILTTVGLGIVVPVHEHLDQALAATTADA